MEIEIKDAGFEVAGSITAISFSKVQSVLKICDGFQIHVMHRMPNRWFRFWKWVFLGWIWEKPQ